MIKRMEKLIAERERDPQFAILGEAQVYIDVFRKAPGQDGSAHFFVYAGISHRITLDTLVDGNHALNAFDAVDNDPLTEALEEPRG